MVTSDQTRQTELTRVLEGLAADLPDPAWVALVDIQGLMIASVPKTMPVPGESIGAMSAVVMKASERVLREIEGGNLRYTSVVGAKWHYLTIVLGDGRLLSIGFKPGTQANAAFGPLRDWMPELTKVLERRFSG